MDQQTSACDRHDDSLSPISWGLVPPRPGLLGWLALYVLVSVAVFGGIATYMIEQRHGSREAVQEELLRELETREVARHELGAKLGDLERALARRDAALGLAAAENEELALALERATMERRALEEERRLARQRALLLDRGARDTALWLETAERERLTIERERAMLEERLVAAEEARDLAIEQQATLRWRLETAEARVARLETEQAEAARWLTTWIEERLGAIQTVLDETGLERAHLLAGLADDEAHGRGGPFLAAPWQEPDEALASSARATGGMLGLGEPATAALIDDLGRLEAAHRLLATVPLATPFDHFHLTSAFGPRADPLTRRRAMHSGVDFGAPAGSVVLATAPGKVIHAGRAGSYGILVEIDHGQGITTRYAHMSEVKVAVGETVGLRQPVGTIGSTGRSTGRHLHYEVRLDGQPRDPARFIAAGRQLIALLGG